MSFSPVLELFYRHLLQRGNNATIGTQEWRALRIQQRQEVDRMCLRGMCVADWSRQNNEVAKLGRQQKLRLDLLLTRQQNEVASIAPRH